MTYLYGDSTPSQLTSNFLEFLRDAVDFAVVLLQADGRITRGQARAALLRKEADAEMGRLDTFTQHVRTTIETADPGDPESATAHFATRLVAVVADTHRSAAHGIRSRLADQIAAIEADEAVARDECFKALEALLLRHDPPDASSVSRIVLSEDGTKYTARLGGRAGFGLDWAIELGIADSNLWATPVTIGRLAPQLEISAPQLTGWISKEVKIKPLRVEKHLVTELVDDGRLTAIKLRAELGSSTGFDLEVDPAAATIRAVRVGPADDPTAGKFELAPTDVSALLELTAKLRAALAEFPRRALVAAQSAGADFRAQPSFVDVVERLVAMMAPITREISDRSLTPNELIMRKPLGNDRREEFFLSKQTLRDKYAMLDELYRVFFDPLGLDPSEARTATPPPAMAPPPAREPEPGPTAPPIPSPPPPQPATPRSVPPPLPPPSAVPPPAVVGSVTARMGALPPARMPPRRELEAPHSPVPPKPISVPPPLPPSAPPPPVPRAEAEDIGSAEIVVVEEPSSEIEVPMDEDETRATNPARSEPPPPVASAPPPVASAPPPASGSVPPPSRASSELVASLKQAIGLTRSGRFQDAYRQFAALFADFGFSNYSPDEQRQALRLMLIPKMKPPPSDVVLDAHRAAIFRLKNLTEAFNDAGDFELLGIAYLALDDAEAARVAFTTGLGIERERNPQSHLVGALMKRVSEI